MTFQWPWDGYKEMKFPVSLESELPDSFKHIMSKYSF